MFPGKKVSQIRPPRYSELRPLFSAQMQFLTTELRPLTFCGRIFSRKSEFSSLVCFVWPPNFLPQWKHQFRSDIVSLVWRQS